MIAPIGYTSTTTGYTSMATGTVNVPFPPSYADNRIEYGKGFDLAIGLLDEESTVTMAYDMILKDYFKAKKENFPNWHELPDIRVVSTGLSSRSIGWHIWVPKDQVIDPLQKEEDELWEN